MAQMDLSSLWGSLGVEGAKSTSVDDAVRKTVRAKPDLEAGNVKVAPVRKTVAQLVRGLDFDQREAVMSDAEQLLVVAGAGSGKTRVFVHRIARLVAEGADPESILALSYTNAAANEVKKRLAAMGIEGVYTSTMHAWCNREPMRNFGHLIGKGTYQILDADGQEDTLRYDMRLGEHGAKRVQLEITAVKNLVEDAIGGYDVDEYNRILARRGQLDFDDLQVHALEILQTQPEVALHYRQKYSHVLVDEYQDVNPVQHEILRMLVAPIEDATGDDVSAPRFTAVGDDSQSIFCQPLGTKVTKVATPRFGREAATHTEVNIEDLKVGDMVPSYGNGILHRGGSEITDIVREPYADDLVVVSTPEGFVSRYTRKHHCIVRVGSELRDKHVVYMMRRGDNYRIGMTPFTYVSAGGQSGLAMRGHSEGADDVWVLSLHDTRKDALTWELIFQTKYRIPSVRFSQTTKADVVDVEAFWREVGSNAAEGLRVLEDFGLEPEFPIWHRGNGVRGIKNVGVKSPFVTAAANLLPGMTVLTEKAVFDFPAGKKLVQKIWSPIEVAREHYEGDVVSLTVERDHTYFADGILTHNCFRGADPHFLINFLDEFPDGELLKLERNYRSTEHILTAGNRIIANNEDRIPKTMWTDKGMGKAIEVREFADEKAEARAVALHIQKVLARKRPKLAVTDIAVLYRRHAQAEAVAEALEEAGIPYWVVADSDVHDRHGVHLRTIHSAKGLEWESVVLLGWNDGSVPMFTVQKDPSLLPEERRIAYVAVTRAKREVLVTVPRKTKTKAGGSMPQKPSRFIEVMRGGEEVAPVRSSGSNRGSYGGRRNW